MATMKIFADLNDAIELFKKKVCKDLIVYKPERQIQNKMAVMKKKRLLTPV